MTPKQEVTWEHYSDGKLYSTGTEKRVVYTRKGAEYVKVMGAWKPVKTLPDGRKVYETHSKTIKGSGSLEMLIAGHLQGDS